jgi:hypothetical protein
VKDLKMFMKEIQLEERDRLRPLYCSRKDFQEFIMDCEKTEKKDGLNLCKEQDLQA